MRAHSLSGSIRRLKTINWAVAMVLAFIGHMTWSVMGVGAFLLSKQGQTETAYSLLYWGSLVLGLANGTVEAFINPVVATMFSREKTKWLNILHAGWPGGLVVAGVLTIFLDFLPWGAKVGMLAAPALIYFFMLIPLKFPIQEREAAGVSYREMLAEFGVLGAAVVGFLVTLQLMDFFQGVEAVSTKTPDGALVLAGWAKAMFIAIGVAIVLAFGVYTRSLGRPLMFFLILIMMPLATTEIGTDGWITTVMEGVAKGKFHPGWILVYTSAIMMVLRFFAGPIVHSLSPLGLLAVSSLLAIVGLLSLSTAAGAMIFVAATLYGFGKTFFWPTMLGVVSEQTPKGGALTLNAISGIGMLAVGTLGFPYIGALQAEQQIRALEESEVAQKVPGLIVDGKLQAVTKKVIYEIISYTIVDQEKLKQIVQQAAAADPQLDAEKVLAELDAVIQRSNQAALGRMAMFPGIMLVGYLILILYFRAQGGYKAQVLVGHEAEDEKFVGGVEGAVEA